MDIKDIKVGDIALLRCEVLNIDHDTSIPVQSVRIHLPSYGSYWINADSIESTLRRPLNVGDIVDHKSGNFPAKLEIVYINGEYAWVKGSGVGVHYVVSLINLTLHKG